MPVKSKAQLGWLASHESAIGGHGKFLEWIHSTPNIKSLPQKVKKEPKK